MLLDHVALSVQLPLHHIGLVEIPAVDAGRLGGDELDGGDVEVLTEAVGCQVDVMAAKFLPVDEDAPALAGEVHAGLVKEAEGIQIVIEGGGPDAQGHLDEGRVAGVSHRLRQSLLAVSVLVGAADILSVNDYGAAAVEGAVAVGGAVLQGHGQGQDLEGGAGLIAVVHRLAAPLEQLGLTQQVIVGLGVFLALLGRVFLIRLGQLGLELFRIDLPGGVGVVVRGGVNGQDGPGIGVHDDAESAVLGPELRDHVGDAPLQVVLDVAVEGGLDAVALLSVIILLILEHQLRTPAVGGRHRQAGSTVQGILVESLQAVGPVVVGVQEADHMGGQGGAGVVPLGVRLQVDPLEGRAGLVFGDERADLVADVLLHPLFQNGVGVLGFCHLTADFFLGDVQNLRQMHGQQILVLLAAHGELFPLLQAVHHHLGPLFVQLPGVFVDGPGVQEHVVRRGGDRQGDAVAVQDGAPGGGDDGRAHLLAGSAVLELVVLGDGQVVGLGEQGQKGRHAEYQQQRQGPPLNDQLGQPGGVGLAPCFFLAAVRQGLDRFGHDVPPLQKGSGRMSSAPVRPPAPAAGRDAYPFPNIRTLRENIPPPRRFGDGPAGRSCLTRPDRRITAPGRRLRRCGCGPGPRRGG